MMTVKTHSNGSRVRDLTESGSLKAFKLMWPEQVGPTLHQSKRNKFERDKDRGWKSFTPSSPEGELKKLHQNKVKIRDSPMHVFTFFHARVVNVPIISTVNSRSVLDNELEIPKSIQMPVHLPHLQLYPFDAAADSLPSFNLRL